MSLIVIADVHCRRLGEPGTARNNRPGGHAGLPVLADAVLYQFRHQL